MLHKAAHMGWSGTTISEKHEVFGIVAPETRLFKYCASHISIDNIFDHLSRLYYINP